MKWKVIVRAYNKEGYQKDILVMDEQQVRMNESRILFLSGYQGPVIQPDVFPEMIRFEILIEEYK